MVESPLLAKRVGRSKKGCCERERFPKPSAKLAYLGMALSDFGRPDI